MLLASSNSSKFTSWPFEQEGAVGGCGIGNYLLISRLGRKGLYRKPRCDVLEGRDKRAGRKDGLKLEVIIGTPYDELRPKAIDVLRKVRGKIEK
ncbi:hypothetical protein Tco_0109951 [Tanacetum coccineum]